MRLRIISGDKRYSQSLNNYFPNCSYKLETSGLVQ